MPTDMTQELKWHPVSEKPTDKRASFVVLTSERKVRYEANYNMDEGFELWEDAGWSSGWKAMDEEVIGWLYEKEISAYLATLSVEDLKSLKK